MKLLVIFLVCLIGVALAADVKPKTADKGKPDAEKKPDASSNLPAAGASPKSSPGGASSAPKQKSIIDPYVDGSKKIIEGFTEFITGGLGASSGFGKQ
nr:silk gland uncharacterized 1 [Tineola bisselliella]